MNFATPSASWAAFVTLLLGAAAGLILAIGLHRLRPSAASLHMRRRDAQASLTLAVDNLRELRERAPRLAAAELDRERAALEARAQDALAALRALAAPEASAGEGRGAEAPSRSPAMSFLAARPQLRGALWGAGAMGLAAFLYVTLQQGAVAVPVAKAPFAAAGGGAPAGGEGVDAAELDALKQALEKNPQDVVALVRLAHLALRAQQIPQADALTQQALVLAPDNVEAQVHAAVVQAGKGEAAPAMAALDALLQRHPDFAEAWFFRGMLSMQAGNMDVMRQSFTQFVRVAPDGPQKERIRAMLQR